MHQPAMAVAHDLELDMMRTFNEFFDVNSSIAERLFRFNPSRMKSLDQASIVVRGAHATAASARNGLNHDRVTNCLGHFKGFFLGAYLSVASRRDRYPRFSGLFPGCILVAHGSNGS